MNHRYQKMINRIYACQALSPFTADTIEENGTKVDIDNRYYNGVTLNQQMIVNIKVDEYYQSLRLGQTPASVDNLVVIPRGIDLLSIYVIELKNLADINYLKPENINRKFTNTLADFIENRFNHHFSDQENNLADLNLLLVCNQFDILGESNVSEEDYKNKFQGPITEAILTMRPFRCLGRVATIQPIFNEYVIR